MKLPVLFLTFCAVFNSAVWALPDLYSREFDDGVVPEDAIVAFTNDGVNGYIGQAGYIDYGQSTATVHAGDTSITFDLYNFTTQTVEVITKNYSIGILCTESTMDHFPWVTTNAAGLADMEDQLLSAGFEGGYVSYVGRFKSPADGLYYTGRVIPNYREWGSGFFYTDGKSFLWSESEDFEVLTYVP